MSTRKPFFPNIQSSFYSLAVITAAVVFLAVFMEWLFAVTRPSFFEYASFGNKIFAYLTDASLITAGCFILMLPFFLLSRIRKLEKLRKVVIYFCCFIPAFILACLVLLLADNFTYTLFKFGIVSTTGILRVVYAVLFVAVTVVSYRKVIMMANGLEKQTVNRKKPSTGRKLLLLSSFLVIWIAIPFMTTALAGSSFESNSQIALNNSKPDIVLITVDGLNAENMSLYGYRNDTTPFLRGLSSTSLLAENAFSNAQGTIGSVTSILTGKYPAETRVLRSVDILEGKDTTQNLPAILKTNGYYTAQLAYSYYADAYKVNMLRAFDSANGKTYEQSRVFSWLAYNLPTYSAYFLQEMYTRLADRLGHIFFVLDMTDAYRRVTEAPEKIDDAQKLEAALDLIATEEAPVFVHIHWMGTHGPKFYPAEQVFSGNVDVDLQGKFDNRLYDDSILEFDHALADFYQSLQAKGSAENTVLIIASDHSLKWTASRLPLLFHFPGNSHAGTIEGNVQNLDIAPTILDHLGLPQPEWMAGQSLLQPADPERPVFIAAIPKSTKNPDTGKVVYPDPEPPFYQFGRMTVVECDTWYRLGLDSLEFDHGRVKNYQGNCENESFGARDALEMIITHFGAYGFETDVLQGAVIDTP